MTECELKDHEDCAENVKNARTVHALVAEVRRLKAELDHYKAELDSHYESFECR